MWKNIFLIFVKIFVLMIPFICISLIISQFPMNFLDGEYAYFYQNEEYSESHKNYCRVLIIGDSVAKSSWLPEKLSDDTYNFALGGTSPVEEYYYLRNYLQNNDVPEYVILTQGIGHFMTIDTLWNRSVYFHRIGTSEILDIYRKSKEVGDESIFDENSLADLFLYNIYSPTFYSTAFFRGLITDRYNENITMYNNVVNNKGQIQFGQEDCVDDVNHMADYTSFDYCKIADYYFREMIKLCRENNIKFIYQSAPFNESTYKNLHEQFIKEYDNYMEQIQEDFPETVINSDIFYFENDCFGDMLHLNINGTIKFSEEMKSKYSYVFEPQEVK